MARSDLLVSLVRAASAGDNESLRSTAEAIAADERAKKHHVLADRIQRAMSTTLQTSARQLTAATLGAHVTPGRDAIIEIEPRIRLDELLLSDSVLDAGLQLISEHVRSDLLRAHGYEPRHKVLLSGPPGNGKTSFAEAVAESLGLPLFVVRYDALIGSFLGETNTRLRKLFDYVKTTPCVLFFDEFDAIGKERGDTHETGEIKRIVSFLLMQLDQLPSYVIVVAATNHAELLDRAVWRRFQLRLAFPFPASKQIEVLIKRIVQSWPEKPRTSLQKIVGALGPLSYAEAVDFCQGVRRRHILGLGEVSIDSAVSAELGIWSSRVNPEGLNANRPNEAIAKAVARKSSRSAARPGRGSPST